MKATWHLLLRSRPAGTSLARRCPLPSAAGFALGHRPAHGLPAPALARRWRAVDAHQQCGFASGQPSRRASRTVIVACAGGRDADAGAVGVSHTIGGGDSNHGGGVRVWLGRIARGLALAAAVAAALLAALPSIVSHRAGLRATLGVVNFASPARVHVERVEAGWTADSTRIEGLRVAERPALGGETLIAVDRITANSGLWGIATGRPYDAVFDGARVDATVDEDGNLKLERLMAAARPLGSRRLPTSHRLPAVASSQEPAPTAAAAAARPDSALQAAAEVALSAEGRLTSCQLFLSDGILRVPEPIAQILGDRVHASYLMGRDNLLQEGSDFGLDTGWAENEAAPPSAGRNSEPTVLALQSPEVSVEAAGWRTATGLLLREPATATFEYTPALARYGLRLLNPLLGDAVAVKHGGRIEVSVAPERLHLPAERTTVRVAPLELAVGRGQLLDRLIGLLNFKALGRMDQLTVATGPLVTDVYKGGPVATRRTDLLISGRDPSAGLHLVLWGQVDPSQGSKVDMVLGIPADTLARLGIIVPDGEVLPVRLSGTSDALVVDWVRASSKLATLLAKSRGDAEGLGQGFARGLVQRMAKGVEGRSGPLTVPAPPLEEPLPWQ